MVSSKPRDAHPHLAVSPWCSRPSTTARVEPTTDTKKCRSEHKERGIPALAAFPPQRAASCSFRQATRGELTAVPRKGQLQPLQTRTDGAGTRRSPSPQTCDQLPKPTLREVRVKRNPNLCHDDELPLESAPSALGVLRAFTVRAPTGVVATSVGRRGSRRWPARPGRPVPPGRPVRSAPAARLAPSRTADRPRAP
jgi:hypothetical protein